MAPAHRHTGTPAHGTPAHRHTGTPAHRHTGTPAHRHTGTPAHRHTGTPAHRTPAHRHTGTPAHRRTGTPAPPPAHRHCATPTSTFRGPSAAPHSRQCVGRGSVHPCAVRRNRTSGSRPNPTSRHHSHRIEHVFDTLVCGHRRRKGDGEFRRRWRPRRGCQARQTTAAGGTGRSSGTRPHARAGRCPH